MNHSINEAEGHRFLFTQTFQNVPLPGTLSCLSACISCGTVALYGPFYLFIFFADHRATVFTLSKTFETAQKNLAPLFCQFCHEIGCENDQTYIFRFVRYLSTFFYTYLPINIHFQFIIIANISFVTNPTYFVRHLASPVVSF